jgi:hypothetical protein
MCKNNICEYIPPTRTEYQTICLVCKEEKPYKQIIEGVCLQSLEKYRRGEL